MTEMQHQLDPELASLEAAAEAEAGQRPDEPSLPPLEWAKVNLFSSPFNTALTIIFAYVGFWIFRSLANWMFHFERRWDAIRVFLRALFTLTYPSSQYIRIWVTLAIVLTLTGLSIGLSKMVGRGFSMKRIATWFIAWGLAVTLGALTVQPHPMVVASDVDGVVTVDTEFTGTIWEDGNDDGVRDSGDVGRPGVKVDLTDEFGNVAYSAETDADGDYTFTELDPGDYLVEFDHIMRDADFQEVRHSYATAWGDRVGWWIIGLALLAIGIAMWVGLGDFRRRNTFVAAMPLTLAVLGLLVSSVWWYNWGHYANQGEIIEPDRTILNSAKVPWTVMWVVLVVAYVVGRLVNKSEAAGTVRGLVNFSWILAPFMTFFVILRDPELDWDHVWSTDVPMALAFMVVGGAILYALSKPGLGEGGRLVGMALLCLAVFNWVAAFFGWYPMLQKARISFLLLALAALAAHNFAGDRRQRLRFASAWAGLMVIVHYLATMINTASTNDAPDEFVGGLLVTLYIAAFTMIFSFPLGALFALGRTSKLPIFRVLSTIYIEVVRGVPFITILFFFTTFLKLFLPEGMDITKIAAASLAFSLFSAAYMAENLRGGLQSIRRGQFEASDALGLTTVQRTSFIILPQALRVSIPTLVGAAIATFKETSLLAIIGIQDFLRVANNIIPNQTEFLGIRLEGLLFVSAVYWIGSYTMSKYSQRLEKHLGVGER